MVVVAMNIDFPATDAYKWGESPCPWAEVFVLYPNLSGIVGNVEIITYHKECCLGLDDSITDMAGAEYFAILVTDLEEGHLTTQPGAHYRGPPVRYGTPILSVAGTLGDCRKAFYKEIESFQQREWEDGLSAEDEIELIK